MGVLLACGEQGVVRVMVQRDAQVQPQHEAQASCFALRHG